MEREDPGLIIDSVVCSNQLMQRKQKMKGILPKIFGPVHSPSVSSLLLLSSQCHVTYKTFFHISLFSLAPAPFGISPLPCPNIPFCTVYLSPGSFQKHLISLSFHWEWRPFYITQQLVHFNIVDCLVLWHLNLSAARILYFSHKGLFLWCVFCLTFFSVVLAKIKVVFYWMIFY